MNSINGEGNCWPTWQQKLLLRAALLQDQDAIEAWEQWRESVDIDYLDPESYQLLPQLYRNLQTQGIKDPLMNRLKGVYRRTWYKNQLLFHHVASIIRSFHEAGIETLILKGAALALLYYKDYGLRPMSDFDLLVPTEQASAAIDLLGKLGWTPIGRSLTEGYISIKHAHGFRDVAGRGFDPHWHVLPECCQENADDEFWGSAVSTKIHDISTYALNPTDQLLHVCVHDARWRPIRPLRWVADAMIILNTSQSEIDWSRLIMQAEKRRLILSLRDRLNYLKNVLSAPIPPTVLQHIQTLPASKREQTEYKFKTRPPAGLLGRLPQFWFTYLRQTDNIGLLQKLVGFSRFIQHTWGVAHPWQVPFYAAFRGLRRIWRMTRPDSLDFVKSKLNIGNKCSGDAA